MKQSRLFLDSANLDEIARLLSTEAIGGVTTNPSLMAKEAKGDYIQRLCLIAKLIADSSGGWTDRHLSVEVLTTDPGLMYGQAMELQERVGNVFVDLYVKIPITLDTLKVITVLSRRGVQVNATAAITCFQAKMAADAGAKVVSFFYRRGCDGILELKDGRRPDEAKRFMNEQIQRFRELNDGKSEIICGSIREPLDVLSCWHAGADIVTAPLAVIEGMTRHPKTDEAIEAFSRDIAAWLS